MFAEVSLSWSAVILRLGIALIAGIVIGLERELSNHPAGMRTHALVCIGAAISSMLACEMAATVTGNPDVSLDISRIAAGVVTGVGFIGAGAIIKSHNKSIVFGLTTAATIWVTACLGLSIGMGYLRISIISLIAILLTTAILKLLEKELIASRGNKVIDLVCSDRKEASAFIEEYCAARRIRIIGIEYTGRKDESDSEGRRIFRCRYSIKLPRSESLSDLLNDWSLQEQIISASPANDKKRS